VTLNVNLAHNGEA